MDSFLPCAGTGLDGSIGGALGAVAMKPEHRQSETPYDGGRDLRNTAAIERERMGGTGSELDGERQQRVSPPPSSLYLYPCLSVSLDGSLNLA